MILKYIETFVGRRPISEIFDFYSGTSAGSINIGSILITKPEEIVYANTGRPVHGKYTIGQLEKLSPDLIKAAFDTSVFRKIRTLGGLLGSQYSAKSLEKLMQETAGNTTMMDLVEPAMITSYDLRNREVFLFSTVDACEDVQKNAYLWEAVRGQNEMRKKIYALLSVKPK